MGVSHVQGDGRGVRGVMLSSRGWERGDERHAMFKVMGLYIPGIGMRGVMMFKVKEEG